MPDEIVLVELDTAIGVHGVANCSMDEVRRISAQAADKMTETMHAMASKVVRSLRKIRIPERPTSVEISFGMKATAEGDIFVTKEEEHAAVKVKLTWEYKEYENSSQSSK